MQTYDDQTVQLADSLIAEFNDPDNRDVAQGLLEEIRQSFGLYFYDLDTKQSITTSIIAVFENMRQMMDQYIVEKKPSKEDVLITLGAFKAISDVSFNKLMEPFRSIN